MTQPSDMERSALDVALQEARSALGSAADVARLRQGLELKLELAQGAPSPLTAANASGVPWSKLVLVALIGAGGLLYGLRQAGEPPLVAQPHVIVPTVVAPAAVVTVPQPVLPAPLDSATPPLAAEGSRSRTQRKQTLAPTEKAEQPAQLDPDVEVALISRAQTALRARPLEALAALDEHAQRFPQGILVQEREALRIDAERALGRDRQAREHALRFLSDYPSSPQARPLSRWLSQPSAAEHKTQAAGRHTP